MAIANGGQDGKRFSSMQDVRPRNTLFSEFSNGRSKEELHMRSLPEREGGGAPDSGKTESRQAYINRRMKQKKKKCDICGQSFSIGPTENWKGRCGECAPKMRECFLTCPICDKRVQIKNAVVITVQISPGKSGSKKFKIYYCSECAMGVRVRSSKLVEFQKKEFDDAVADQREEMKFLTGKSPQK